MKKESFAKLFAFLIAGLLFSVSIVSAQDSRPESGPVVGSSGVEFFFKGIWQDIKDLGQNVLENNKSFCFIIF